MSDSEVKSNNVDTQRKGRVWLETIQDGLDRANAMFDLNLSVALRFEESEAVNDGISINSDTNRL